jgi:hypothetical protein
MVGFVTVQVILSAGTAYVLASTVPLKKGGKVGARREKIVMVLFLTSA